MRRNFPRPYTTTYLRVVVVGQLVALADSEITLSRLAVLTGFDTVSFHSVSLSVSFDAVSDWLGPCKCSSRPRLPMLQQFLPTCRDLPLHVPWRLWKVRESNPQCSSQAFQGITAAVVGCRSISSVGGPSIPLFQVAGLLRYSGFHLPCYVRGIAFRFLNENQRTSQRAGFIRSIKLLIG